VMTYNILAEVYADMDGIPKEALSWKYRLNNLITEINYYQPDILCLQEVDHFDDIKAKLEGYLGYFKKRNGWHPDGSSIFFNAKRFKLLEEMTIELNDIVTNTFLKENFKDLSRFHRDNIGIFLLLEDILTSKRICIGTTHLYWNPEFNDVKLMQAQEVVDSIFKFAKKNEANNVILTGDFNSEPDGGVYQYITTGSLSDKHPLRKLLPTFNFTTSNTMASAYSSLKEPNTNFTSDYVGCLDYIWYTKESIELISILDDMEKYPEAFKPVRIFPNMKQPSDHICLFANFFIV